MTEPFKEISIEEFQLIKEKISNLDYSRTTIEEIFEIIKPLLKGMGLTAVQTAIDLTLFRGVKWNNKPQTIDKISYPPRLSTKINRASDVGQQMFYSSTSKNITFYEMYLKKGDRVAISQWRPNIHLVFLLVGYIDDNLKKMGASRTIDFGPMKFVSDVFANPSDQEVESAKFIADLFCQNIPPQDENKYKLTIAITRLLTRDHYVDAQKKDGRFSGLVYPSIKGNGEHDNYAINIDLIDNKFIEPYNVEFIEIVDYESQRQRYKYKILDYADSFSENRINWKEIKNSWTIWDDQEIFFGESMPIRAFTSDGDECIPD